MKLKRELGLGGATLYGISLILGTGIYTLIGIGAGLAGDALWISFAVSALIAIFTALSYAELSAAMPYEAAAYHYTRRAFGSERASFIIDWMFAFSAMMFAATETFGFSAYLSAFAGIDQKALGIGLLAAVAILNYLGLRYLSLYNKLSISLSIIVLAAFSFLSFSTPDSPGIDFSALPESGFLGIISAASVIFFAYTGFEGVAEVSEEVKKSRATVPKAIMLSIVICSAIYIAVSLAALNIAGAEALSQSAAPLAMAATRISGAFALLLSIAAIMLTSNTALNVVSTGSRVLYGMSHAGSLEPSLSSLSARSTPARAILFVTAVAALAFVLTDIKTTAQLTNVGFFVAYFAVNVSLIVLRNQGPKGGFGGPRLLGYPAFAVLGAASSLFMLAYLILELWAVELAVLSAGLVLFALRGPSPERAPRAGGRKSLPGN